MPAPDPRPVLVATDLGPGSEDVVRTAARVAAASGAELHVLHAFDWVPDPYPELIATPTPGFQDRVRDSERALDEQLRRTVPGGAAVAARRVVIDSPARAVLDYAEGVGAGLVVLGPHRRGGVGDFFLGSTADRVVRSAAAPCLVVRAPLRLPLRRVVVPMDLSAPSRGALEAALRACEALGDRGSAGELGPGAVSVDVVHVVPRVLAGEDFPFGEAVVGPELHREVEAVLGPAEDRADLEVREVVVWGDSAADEIVRVAAGHGADLVVMGTHGRGALGRALLGSVASSVARRAECPVLLVPPALAGPGEPEAG